MSDHRSVVPPEAGDAPAAGAVAGAATAKLLEAAQTEIEGKYSAKTAVRVVENSDYVNKLFPGTTAHDKDERDAAYYYLMHAEGVPDYETPQTDARLLSPQGKTKLETFLQHHQVPSIDPTMVEKEAQAMRKLGFPSPVFDANGNPLAVKPADAAPVPGHKP